MKWPVRTTWTRYAKVRASGLAVGEVQNLLLGFGQTAAFATEQTLGPS